MNVILLNVPLHPFLAERLDEYKERYYSFAEKYLPKATLINHSNMDIPEQGFGDLLHLNYKGAGIYSQYLKKYGFTPLPNQ